MGITTFVDSDSICYAASYCEHPSQMEQTFDNYINDIRNATQCENLVGFVENPDFKHNFRKWVAVSRPYKGNRRAAKPMWLREAKLYSKQRWGFHFVNAMESEDACLISAYENGIEDSIIAFCDKDVLQVAAKFYNYRTKEMIQLTEDQAAYNLHYQFLAGDVSVDNVPGVPGCGDVGAKAVLDGVKPSEYTTAVAKFYKEKELPYEYLIEQTRLIYLLRRRGEVYTIITREEFDKL